MRSILTKTILPILCLCTSLRAAALPMESAAAQQTTLVHLAPAQALVGEGQTAAVEVRVEDVQDLYGLDIRLSFDPAAIQVVDADPATDGIQVQPGSLLSPDFVVRNTADNQDGTVWFALTQLNPTQEVSGSGAAFIVTFAGKSAGSSSPISFTYVKMAQRSGEEIPASTEDGQISVVEPGEAPPQPTQAPPPQPTVVTPTPTAAGATTATPTPTAASTESPTTVAPTDTPTPAPTTVTTRPSPTIPTPSDTPAPGPTPMPTQSPSIPTPTMIIVATSTAASVAGAEVIQPQSAQPSPSPTSQPASSALGKPSALLALAGVAGLLGSVLDRKSVV